MKEEIKSSKIINIKCEKANNFIVTYRGKGKDDIFEKRAKEIAKNTEELKCFSVENIRTICTYAILDALSPKFKIANNCLDLEEPYFEVFEILTDKKLKMNPLDIYKNKKLLHSLSSEDAFLVGYMVKEIEDK